MCRLIEVKATWGFKIFASNILYTIFGVTIDSMGYCVTASSTSPVTCLVGEGIRSARCGAFTLKHTPIKPSKRPQFVFLTDDRMAYTRKFVNTATNCQA